MWQLTAFLAIASVSFAADDGWAKVKALASGTELRIVKAGTKAPILAKFDEATEESLVIATKTEQFWSVTLSLQGRMLRIRRFLV